MNNNIEHKLSQIKTKDLSAGESAALWQRIWYGRGQQYSWSPLTLSLTYKNMLAVFLALAILVSGSAATVQAADAAKPGDWLFSVDQAVEKVQLALSSGPKKAELKVRLAAERSAELEQIIAEVKIKGESKKSDDNIKASLNLVADINSDPDTGQSTATAEKMQKILQAIENQLGALDNPVKLQVKFKGDKDVKFEIEAEEEDDGEIKVRFNSKGIKFFTGQSTSTNTSTATSTPGRSDNEKIKVCHVVSSSNRHDLKISRSALSAHLAHGDTIGECPEDDDEDDDRGRNRDDDDRRPTTLSTSTSISIDPIRLNDELQINLNVKKDKKDNDRDNDD